MLGKVQAFAENAYVNLVSGLILLVTAGVEIVSSLDQGTVGARHGVALFGLLQVLQYLPHVVHGAEQVSKLKK